MTILLWLASYFSDPLVIVGWSAIAIAFAYTWWPRDEKPDLHGEQLWDEIERQWLQDDDEDYARSGRPEDKPAA